METSSLLLFSLNDSILCVASKGTNLVLEGRHNADKGWMAELRQRGNVQVKETNGPCVQIVKYRKSTDYFFKKHPHIFLLVTPSKQQKRQKF